MYAIVHSAFLWIHHADVLVLSRGWRGCGDRCRAVLFLIDKCKPLAWELAEVRSHAGFRALLRKAPEPMGFGFLQKIV